MSLISSLKASAIRFADTLNKLKDPWEPFTRSAVPATPGRTLHEMEREFYGNLTDQFWGCDGRVLLHRIPYPAGSPLDTGDQAIWHGVFTAMLAMRYHVLIQAEPGSEEFARSSETYSHLVEAAKGLQLHQTVHGETRPRLIRGVQDDGRTYQDDASNDSATGHLLGIYFGWKFGPETMQPVFAQLAAGLAAELHNHADCLVAADGTPTTYGALEQGWKTDPLRISLALAIYAVGATLTKEKAFIQDYERLYRKYKSLFPYPKVRLWWKENYNDTHRGAIHLGILADLTSGDPHQLCVNGLERISKDVVEDGNIWVNEWWCFGKGQTTTYWRAMALKVLSEFSLAGKQDNTGRDNYNYSDRRFGLNHTLFRKVLWNGKWMASVPVPRWGARAQDFFWQRNLRSLDEGSENAPPDSRLNCGDWLCAYWLARLNKTLTETD